MTELPATPPRTGAPRIVALWSTPRSVSTAFLRMMIERGDFNVLHEPFSYLAEFGEVDVDGVRVRRERDLIARIRELSVERPVFFKDTSDERYPGLLADPAFLGTDVRHAFLIRDPRETVASYFRINPDVRPNQIGFAHQEELFEAVSAANGTVPFIIDAAGLLRDPAATVEAFCARVGIPFLPEALTWQPGERSEWGPSQRWHQDAARSTGFFARPVDRAALDDMLARPRVAAVLAAQQPHYDALVRHVASAGERL